MDTPELTLIETTAEPIQLQMNNIGSASEEKKKQIARDFESLLINKLLDEMKNTIGDWGFEQDGPCRQIQGMFWFYLAQDLADKGGFGLWKDIYKYVENSEQTTQKAELLDENI
jgi:Rod binding domain-containing protein